MRVKQNLLRFALILIISNFLSSVSNGQPSYVVGFQFRLFDNNGHIVEYENFCKNFKMLGELNRDDQTSCTNSNIPKEHTYNDKTKFYDGSGVVVYNDLLRKFIHRNDTMTLILKTDLGISKPYRIDSLVMKSGIYLITDHNLKSIDFKKAEVDYYNYLLEYVLSIKNQISNYENSGAYIELNRLRKRYGFSLQDYTEKRIGDIFK
ncbi:hypothetical protein GXP67_01545 [Rhodocytophaga rosea]|uniref:Uncharacterized protein n=1 Tax=Rhodocytophaga rosea TaxID=2704465 RepID=A0A6C0GCP2_9BACT|nr:hypothetical protein [Rhodocytophaga rosea]QHT65450.1 hypothetical protein GXP67_01545 [Rhodocytophaga rosea]